MLGPQPGSRHRTRHPRGMRQGGDMASPSDALKLGEQNGARFVDIRFSDLPGLMQHFSVPFEEFTEEAFEEGLGFDGSSIRGFQEIQESDMILLPDADTAVMDPFRKH